MFYESRGLAYCSTPNREDQGFSVRVVLPLVTDIPFFKGVECLPFAAVVAQLPCGTALPGLQRGYATADLVAEPI